MQHIRTVRFEASLLQQGAKPAEDDAPEPSHQEHEAEVPSNAFIAEAGLPIKGTLVVAPKSVLPNWKREIEKGVRSSLPFHSLLHIISNS